VTIEVLANRRRRIDSADVVSLYESEAWWPERRPEDIAAVLAKSPAAGAWDGDRLIGFARVVTDGRFHAYVEDMIVRERYRRRGVAAQLLSTMLAELPKAVVWTLFCSPELVAVYESAGFQRTDQIVLHKRT